MRLDPRQNSILLSHDVHAEGLEDRVAAEREENPLVERREGGAFCLPGGDIGRVLLNLWMSLAFLGLFTLSSATGGRLYAILRLTSYDILQTTYRRILSVIQKFLKSLVDRVGFLFIGER